jgi:hypothetical protein
MIGPKGPRFDASWSLAEYFLRSAQGATEGVSPLHPITLSREVLTNALSRCKGTVSTRF